MNDSIIGLLIAVFGIVVGLLLMFFKKGYRSKKLNDFDKFRKEASKPEKVIEKEISLQEKSSEDLSGASVVSGVITLIVGLGVFVVVMALAGSLFQSSADAVLGEQYNYTYGSNTATNSVSDAFDSMGAIANYLPLIMIAATFIAIFVFFARLRS